MQLRYQGPAVAIAVVSSLLAACSAQSTAATTRATTERLAVDHVIVRYEMGAPPSTDGGAPWGSQCVSSIYSDRLERGRWIGAGMRVIRVNPPLPPKVARAVALQIAQCPYIEWAEADDTLLSIPPEDLLSD